ncbi:MAG TPA: DUF1272 domain-containing protein [Candidatus Thermoplasmatota archaeon]|nr:DUF1272 domain-containing protein [Candidatus Thermoplasmatota archaeon]
MADAPVPDVEMKDACESCAAPLTWVSDAYTCSYNCTFCSECTQDMAFVCPNCGGHLEKRAPNTQPVGNRKKS